MVTTIQISTTLLKQLKTMKINQKESYEDIIWELVEDRLTLSEETQQLLKQAEQDVKQGRLHTWQQVKKDFDV